MFAFEAKPVPNDRTFTPVVRLARTLFLLGGLWVFLTVRGVPQSAPSDSTDLAPLAVLTGTNTETVVLPEPLADPIEPFNRAVWAFNKGVMTAVVKPTAKVYRFVVRKPLRTGIGNFGANIAYPGRLFNNLLQGKWTGARDETYRFLCNSVIGMAGFLDVATKWHIPKSEADFGQTFGQWGWKPNAFVMLPILGPSNDRDTLGFAADSAANPLSYLTPYPFTADDPLSYLSPYAYCSFAVTYNNLSGPVEDYVRFSRTEKDAYSELEYAWSYVRENRVVDFKVEGQTDPASLETLQSVFFSFRDPRFPERGKTWSVLIPATGQKLEYTFWLQRESAPVVYIVPGLGSHRLAGPALALAELVYRHGFSAVCISSPFNYEFIEHAATAAVPAYTPVDAHDLHVAVTEIDRQLQRFYPHRLGPRALMGYSMGAFESLFLAAASSLPDQTSLVKFDRYVAINTPVRLLHGMAKLDELFQAPAAWPAQDRDRNIENTFLKVAALTHNSLTPQTSLPFSGIESKFLIGVTFRLILRDAIYSSQERQNLGVLQHQITKRRRQPLYHEILQYTYGDYFDRFVIPYYQSRGIDLRQPAELERASDLRAYADPLRANNAIRMIVNRNDFLLADTDLQWLQQTFAPAQLTVFEQGGHLGNLSHPDVQQAILRALDGLALTNASTARP